MINPILVADNCPDCGALNYTMAAWFPGFGKRYLNYCRQCSAPIAYHLEDADRRPLRKP